MTLHFYLCLSNIKFTTSGVQPNPRRCKKKNLMKRYSSYMLVFRIDFDSVDVWPSLHNCTSYSGTHCFTINRIATRIRVSNSFSQEEENPQVRPIKASNERALCQYEWLSSSPTLHISLSIMTSWLTNCMAPSVSTSVMSPFIILASDCSNSFSWSKVSCLVSAYSSSSRSSLARAQKKTTYMYTRESTSSAPCSSVAWGTFTLSTRCQFTCFMLRSSSCFLAARREKWTLIVTFHA